MSTPSIDRSAFAGYRFPPEVIVLAVRWYLRYGLSYRDIEELLAERGIVVDHVSVYRWVQTFTPMLVDAARCRRHGGGDRWFVDETYVRFRGAGCIRTERLTSTARCSTYCCPTGAISLPPAGSSNKPWRRRGRRWR